MGTDNFFGCGMGGHNVIIVLFSSLDERRVTNLKKVVLVLILLRRVSYMLSALGVNKRILFMFSPVYNKYF